MIDVPASYHLKSVSGMCMIHTSRITSWAGSGTSYSSTWVHPCHTICQSHQFYRPASELELEVPNWKARYSGGLWITQWISNAMKLLRQRKYIFWVLMGQIIVGLREVAELDCTKNVLKSCLLEIKYLSLIPRCWVIFNKGSFLFRISCKLWGTFSLYPSTFKSN